MEEFIEWLPEPHRFHCQFTQVERARASNFI